MGPVAVEEEASKMADDRVVVSALEGGRGPDMESDEAGRREEGAPVWVLSGRGPRVYSVLLLLLLLLLGL